MKLFYAPDILDGNHSLDAEEARHAIRVLRLQIGDALKITDGKGNIYDAHIKSISKSACEFSIDNTRAILKKAHFIHIAIAPTKNVDRIEWFVEKATELGVDEISFIKCKNSERSVINLERIQKKAVSALKQSGQAWLPIINSIKPMTKVLGQSCPHKFIAHVDLENTKHLKDAVPNGKYCVLIGPEGDFAPEEIKMAIDNGYQKISLGSSTLRTETAGIAACHILNLINQ